MPDALADAVEAIALPFLEGQEKAGREKQPKLLGAQFGGVGHTRHDE